MQSSSHDGGQSGSTEGVHGSFRDEEQGGDRGGEQGSTREAVQGRPGSNEQSSSILDSKQSSSNSEDTQSSSREDAQGERGDGIPASSKGGASNTTGDFASGSRGMVPEGGSSGEGTTGTLQGTAEPRSERRFYYFWPRLAPLWPRPAFLDDYPPEADGLTNINSFLGSKEVHGGQLYVPRYVWEGSTREQGRAWRSDVRSAVRVGAKSYVCGEGHVLGWDDWGGRKHGG